MKRTTAFLAAIAFCAMCSVHADYSVFGEGAWPKSWPEELESLRKHSSTIQGSRADLVTHHIPFTKREEFESAWSHILKVKTKGTPVILLRSPSDHWHFGKTTAGVLVHSPPAPSPNPEGPVAKAANVRDRWMWTTYIELVVDGEIVDLNRIPLPEDTPIVDERFKDRD